MKQMERKISITYRWWRDDNKAIKPAHIVALEETAEDKVLKMVGEGYREGELHDNIHMTANDPEDGIAYAGYWEVERS